MGRLRLGELAAGAGAVGLAVVLLLDWFAVERRRGGTAYAPIDIRTAGWEALGWPLVVVVGLVIAAVAWLLIATLRRHTVAPAVGAAVLTACVGTLVFVVLLVRLALAQPALGFGLADDEVAVLAPAYLGLLACALIAAGGWWSVGDERTEARHSAYAPPPARPVPPAV